MADLVKKEIKVVMSAVDMLTQPFRRGVAAIRDLKSSFTTAGREANEFGSAIDQVANPLERVTEKAQRAANVLQNVVTAFGGATILYAFKQGLTSVASQFSDFDAKMRQVQFVSGATADEFERLKEKAIELGAETKFAATDAADTFYEMASAGLDVETSVSAVEVAMGLATAGATDLTTATNTMIVAAKAFKLEASEFPAIADSITYATTQTALKTQDMAEALATGGGVAALAGQNLQSFIAAVSALRDAGVGAAEAGTTIKSALLNGIISPSSEAQKWIEKLKLEFRDSEGRIKQWADIIAELEIKMAGLSEAERQAALTAIFGSYGINAIAASMRKGSGELTRLTQGMEEARGITQQFAQVMKENLGVVFEDLLGTIETLALKIGEDLSAPLKIVIRAVDSVIAKLNEMDESTRHLIEVLAGGVGLFGALTTVTAAIGGLIGVIGLMGAPVGAVMAVLAGLSAAITAVGLAAVRTAEENAFSNLMEDLSQQAEGFRQKANEIKQVIDELDTKIFRQREKVDLYSGQISQVEGLVKRYETLANKTSLTAQEQAELREVVDKLNQAIPGLNLSYDQTAQNLDEVKQATSDYIEKKRDELKLLREQLSENLRAKITQLELERQAKEQQLALLDKKIRELSSRVFLPIDAGQRDPSKLTRLQQQLLDLKKQADDLRISIGALDSQIVFTRQLLDKEKGRPIIWDFRISEESKEEVKKDAKEVKQEIESAIESSGEFFRVSRQGADEFLSRGQGLLATLEGMREALQAGRLDPESYFRILDDLVAREREWGNTSVAVFDQVQEQKEAVLSEAIATASRLFEAGQISESEFVRRVNAYLAAAKLAGDRRVLIENETERKVSDVRLRGLQEVIAKAQQAAESGRITWDEARRMVDDYIAKMREAGGVGEDLNNRLLQAQQRFSAQARQGALDDYRYKVRTYEMSLEAYRDHLRRMLEAEDLSVTERRSLASELKAVEEQIQWDRPIKAASAAIDLFRTRLQSLQRDQDRAARQGRSSLQENLEQQVQAYQRMVDMELLLYRTQLQRAQLEKDPVKRSALLRDAMETETRLRSLMREWENWSKDKTYLWKTELQDSTTKVNDELEKGGEIITKAADEAGKTLEQTATKSSEKVEGAVEKVEGRTGETAKALREFKDTHSRVTGDLKSAVSDLASKITTMAQNISTVGEKLGQLPEKIQQNFNVQVANLRLEVEELRNLIENEVQNVFVRV